MRGFSYWLCHWKVTLCLSELGNDIYIFGNLPFFFLLGGKCERGGLVVLAVWLVTFGVHVHFFIILGVSTELVLTLFFYSELPSSYTALH